MNNCIICGKECKGECCSGACRARKSRRTRTKDQRTPRAHTLTKAESHVGASQIGIVKALHEAINEQAQATFYRQPLRAIEPVKPSLPGDPDYDGVCLDAKYDSHRRADYV